MDNTKTLVCKDKDNNVHLMNYDSSSDNYSAISSGLSDFVVDKVYIILNNIDEQWVDKTEFKKFINSWASKEREKDTD